MSDAIQEFLAIAIALGAALYLVRRVFGSPRKREKSVLVGARLTRGLDRARKR